MTTLATAWMLGCLTGWFMGVVVASRPRPTCRELMRDHDWRRSFNGYQPRPQQGTPNPPPSEP